MKQKNFRFLVLAMLVCIGIGTWAIKAKSSGNVAKIGSTEYATFADALSAVQDGDVIYLLANADASSVAFTPCNGKKVIIAGTTGNELLNMGDGAKGGISGTTEITFLNLKMQIRHTNPTGTWYCQNIYHAGKVKYENVVFDGAIATADYVEFLNCTFASNPQSMEYTVWNYGGTQVFKGCTFKEESAGTKSFIKDYAEPAGTLATNLVMAECTFNVPSPTPSGWKGSTIYFSTANSSTSKIYLDEQTKQAGGSINYSSGCDSKAEVCSSLEATGFTLPTPTFGADLEIGTVAELVAFAQTVNGTPHNTWAGKTVVLTANIDLNGVEWTPIGNVNDYPSAAFAGTFDGKGYTISNLTCVDNTANYACAGFFGSLTGSAIVKDLTLADVNIQSTHYAGGVCAYIGGTNTVTISNCKVDGGTIKSTPELINGEYDNGDKVGGIIGYTVAGVTVSACAVEDATISAYRDLGGIAGYAAGTVEQCSVSNCTIIQDNTNAYKDEITTYAEIVGRNDGATTTNNESSEVTLKQVSGKVVAKIGDVEYASLAKAVAAVPTDGTETTIAMIDDETIEGNAGVTIAKGQNIILNLNGKTVKNLVNENKASQLITNNGTLKITGDGTMTNDLADGTIAGDWPTYNYATNLITNLGTLTIENGTFNNTQDSGITYTLDNNSNGVPATATINGGTFKSAGNAAVRMFCNSTTAANTLTINGGYFEGTYYAVSVSNASGATKVGSLTINGGEFESTADEYNACIANWESNKSSNIAVNITGGKFNDYVLVASNASVTGGTFKYDKYTDPDDGTVYDLNTYCAEGFELVQNADGTFGIEAKPAPAEEIKVAEELAITPTDGGSDLTTEQKAAATEAIETLVSNAEASTLPEETKESNTAAVNEEILQEGQSVVVDVVIKGATVSTAGDNIVIKQVTFDVTPYVAENGKATDTEIENKDIEKPITFRLPVAASVTDTKAAVYHEGEPLGIKNIATGTDGSKYIEISSTEFSEFSYTLLSSVPAPATVKYYEGNSTEKTGTIDDFVTAAATNKNAIAIVSSEYEDLAALYTNVIVDYAVGKGHYYECPNFVLTDLVDFYTPVAFVAVSGSYSRSNTAGKNSVCLPFAIDEEMLDAVKIGTFVSANLTGAEGEKTGSFYFRSNASVEAGTPCIVECSETVTSWNVVFNNTQIVAQPNNANALQGTFVEKEIGKDYFKVSEDGKSFVNSNEGSCNYPFRACVDLTNDSDFGFVKAINFVWEDEYEDEATTTGISNVNVEKEANTAYGLSGRKAEKLVKGNIYIIKGKKTIIK